MPTAPTTIPKTDIKRNPIISFLDIFKFSNHFLIVLTPSIIHGFVSICCTVILLFTHFGLASGADRNSADVFRVQQPHPVAQQYPYSARLIQIFNILAAGPGA